MAPKPSGKPQVFLNLPYDASFERPYLGYIVGLSALGIVPRAALDVSGPARLERIRQLLRACDYSIHDLSRVQLDAMAPRVPRFNMPFELGMGVALAPETGHRWFVFETTAHRVQKSLSDLNGTDVFAHGGTVQGVLRELCNVFVAHGSPSVGAMVRVWHRLSRDLPQIQAAAGTDSLFGARMFKDLCFAAGKLVRDLS